MAERRTLRLSGEVDMTVASTIEAQLRSALEDPPVQIDVTDVTFMDSSGLNVFLRLYKPGLFTVTRGNKRIDRLLAITGLEMLHGDMPSQNSEHQKLDSVTRVRHQCRTAHFEQ